MPITQSEVEKVAALANLELTAEEKELFFKSARGDRRICRSAQ
jgi:Asp-tRNA(Asn)/Glu-tRNA(Gln) amidotransferase C subunit